MLAYCVEESLFAFHRAGRAFLIAQHDDFALLVQALGHVGTCEASSAIIVGGDKGDEVFALKARVDNDDRDAAAYGIGDGHAKGGVVEGREYNARNAARDEVFDQCDLVFAVVFFEWAFPYYFYV